MVTLTPATRMGLSIAAAVGLYGVSFGALAVASGLSVWQTQVFSLLMFTGGSQFAFVGAGGGPAGVVSAVLLGVRNMVYAAELKAQLRPAPVTWPVHAQVTIDESFAVAVAQRDPVEKRRGFWSAGVGIFVLWNLFTLVGALLGATLDAKVYGLDGAAVAAFLGLLWPRLRTRDAIATGIVAAVVTTVAVPLLPNGLPLLVAAAVSAAIGISRRRVDPATAGPRPAEGAG